MSRMHTYVPPSVEVVAPGDGNKIIVGTWPDGEQIVIVLTEAVAKTIAERLLAPSIAVVPNLEGL